VGRRPPTLDPLTREADSRVDVLPVDGGEGFLDVGRFEEVDCKEGEEGGREVVVLRRPLDATFRRCRCPVWCSLNEEGGKKQLHGSQRMTSWLLEQLMSLQVPPF